MPSCCVLWCLNCNSEKKKTSTQNVIHSTHNFITDWLMFSSALPPKLACWKYLRLHIFEMFLLELSPVPPKILWKALYHEALPLACNIMHLLSKQNVIVYLCHCLHWVSAGSHFVLLFVYSPKLCHLVVKWYCTYSTYTIPSGRS